MGKFDRVLRIVISLVFAMMIFNNAVTGIQYYILLVVSIMLVITAVAGTCPLYVPLNINTNKK